MFRPITLTRRETRMLWIVGAAFAAILTLLFLQSTVGATEREPLPGPPPMLSPLDASTATPLVNAKVLHQPYSRMSPALPRVESDQVMLVWDAIGALRAADYEGAIAMWEGVLLRDEAEVWRQIAIGEAHMALGNLEEAADALKLAHEIRPDNAVVHYYLGILRLEQARYAPDYYDAMGIEVIRLAAYWPQHGSYTPEDIIPNSRSMYRMVARVELERAVELAAQVDLDDPLTPDYYDDYVALRPTVRDLLLALGATNMPARAHNMLGPMLIEDGALAGAEDHIDAARDAGMFVGYSYVDLVTELEKQGHWLDAARVSAKAVGHGMDEPTAYKRAMLNIERWFAG